MCKGDEMKKFLLIFLLLTSPVCAEPDWLDDIIDGDTVNGPYMPRPNPRAMNPPIFNNWGMAFNNMPKEAHAPIPPRDVIPGYYPWLPDGTRTPAGNFFSLNWRF